jgi:hypothetical protein
VQGQLSVSAGLPPSNLQPAPPGGGGTANGGGMDSLMSMIKQSQPQFFDSSAS